MDIISTRLKEFRKKNGFTQQQVADMLNLDRSTYSYYEIGKINPSVSTLALICDIYEVGLDEFLALDERKLKAASSSASYDYILSDNEKRLVSCFRQLSTEEQEQVLVSVITLSREKENN